MNKLLADLNVLYVKLHSLHYNVVGSDFVPTHLFLEAEYNNVHEWIDVVAEEMKMVGDSPLTNLVAMLEVTEIKECTSDQLTTKEAYAAVHKDYNYLIEQIRTLKETTPQLTTNALEDIESELVKKVWFLNAMNK
jgi:starvation-inducible DNA-binding protein